MKPNAIRLACVLAMATLTFPALAKDSTEAERKAIFLHMPPPDYPVAASRNKTFGKGDYRMFIDEKGRITEVKVLQSTGSAELDHAVTARLKQWLAKPGARREIDVPVDFSRPVKRLLINPGGAHYIRIESHRDGPLVTAQGYGKELTYRPRLVKSPGREVTAFVAEGMSDAEASRILASFPYYSPGTYK
jgi:TonB family protein